MNAAPKILPALRRWHGAEGSFVPDADTVLFESPVSGKIQHWFDDLFGLRLTLVSECTCRKSIRFAMQPGYGREGYALHVTENQALITASAEIGLLYGGITLLQGLYASEARSFPCGEAEDFPAYPVRSGMLDVARAYIPMHRLQEAARYMAWFKLNELHVHINDTGKHGYDAFRLESDVPGLTSKDGFYTKEEYRAFQREMLEYGVTVITEIDTPYHASCFSKVTETPPKMLGEGDGVPWWCYGKCLDIRDEQTVQFVKALFSEYLGGNDPVFVNRTVHIGMDEYPAEYKAEMTRYVKEIAEYVNSLGYTARFWSGFAAGGCMNKITFSKNADVQLNYWDYGLSGPAETVDAGFPIVNSINAYLYIVPGNAEAKLGGYTDVYHYEDYKLIYERWQVNLFSLYAEKRELLPADDPRMLGASFSIWNDSHSAHLGLTYRDVVDRIAESVCLVSEKTWCGTDTASIPFDDFYQRFRLHSARAGGADPFERTLRGEALAIDFSCETLPKGTVLHGAEVKDGAFPLNGSSYFSHAVGFVGFPFTAELALTLTCLPNSRTALFESGDGSVSIFAEPDGTLGFTTMITLQDFNEFRFSYRLPVGKETKLRFSCNRFQTTLSADGTEFPAVSKYEHLIAEADRPKGRYSTLTLPLHRVGCGFTGSISYLKIKNEQL